MELESIERELGEVYWKRDVWGMSIGRLNL
jgi:hypothetical protein